ncbi:hypothetical protein ACFLYH_02140, partial [Candidatus Dependentiae bacterium]
ILINKTTLVAIILSLSLTTMNAIPRRLITKGVVTEKKDLAIKNVSIKDAVVTKELDINEIVDVITEDIVTEKKDPAIENVSFKDTVVTKELAINDIVEVITEDIVTEKKDPAIENVSIKDTVVTKELDINDIVDVITEDIVTEKKDPAIENVSIKDTVVTKELAINDIVEVITEDIVTEKKDPAIENVSIKDTVVTKELAINDIVDVVTEKIEDTKENFKQETLVLGQAACFLKTHGNDPFFNIIRPDIDEIKIIKCGCVDEESGKPRHIKNTCDLANLCPIEQILNGFGGNYRYKMKYQGERTSNIGKLIDNYVSPKIYPGKIIVDEYKQNLPMFWILRNVDELRNILIYFTSELEKEEFTPSNKTLLVLKLDNDKKLSSLNERDKEILDTYFKLFPLTDPDIKKFFETAKSTLLAGNDYMSKNPKYVGETASESILRQTEKYYKDFKSKDYAIMCGCFITFLIIQDLLKDEIETVKTTIQAGFKSRTGSKTIIGAIKSLFFNTRNQSQTD